MQPSTTPTADEPAAIPTEGQAAGLPPAADTTPPMQNGQGRAKPKKWLWLLLAALVLAAAGAASWWYGRTPTATTNNRGASSQAATAGARKADTVVFSSATATGQPPYTLYTMPVQGGQRTKAVTLSNEDGAISSSDIHEQNVVFATDKGIYVSRDSGKTYKRVYDVPKPASATTLQAVTSVHFSGDGKRIVFAFLSDIQAGKAQNTVKIMDLDGQHLTDLHSFENAGIFIYSYTPANQQLVYTAGCYFCDGGSYIPHLYDLKVGTDKQLIVAPTDGEVLNTLKVSNDGKKLLYYTGTSDALLRDAAGGLGWPGGPPYKVVEVDIASGAVTQLASIGSLHEKNAAGSYKLYTVLIGFTADKQLPLYTADNKLYSVQADKVSTLFEANKTIWALPYVAHDELFASVDNASDQNSNYVFYRYSPVSSRATPLFQGSTYTQVLGITTR